MGTVSYLIVIVALNILHYVLSLNSDIAVAVIAAAATIFVSVISIVLGKIYEVRYQIQQEIREKKIPVYEELIHFMQRVFANEKLKVKPSEEELQKFFLEWQQKVMIWGSDSVLKDWIKWRRVSINAAGTHEAVFLYEQLILQIRCDLGHKNKNLKRGAILSLFVNDIYKYVTTTHSK